MNTRQMNTRSPEYLFRAEPYKHIVNRAYTFDENPEYHQDRQGALRGMKMLKNISQHYAGNTYLLLAGQRLSFSHEHRVSDAGREVFLHYEELWHLDHIEVKLNIGFESLFPVAMVDLRDFKFDVNNHNYFHSNRLFYIFTDLDLETVCCKTQEWIYHLPHGSGMNFNREAMVSGLLETDAMAFFQYQPSHNTHYEAMSLVGPRRYVDNVLTPCIDKALAGKVVSIKE